MYDLNQIIYSLIKSRVIYPGENQYPARNMHVVVVAGVVSAAGVGAPSSEVSLLLYETSCEISKRRKDNHTD